MNSRTSDSFQWNGSLSARYINLWADYGTGPPLTGIGPARFLKQRNLDKPSGKTIAGFPASRLDQFQQLSDDQPLLCPIGQAKERLDFFRRQDRFILIQVAQVFFPDPPQHRVLR